MKPGLVINDRYQIKALIGRGGTSDVYLVNHIHLNSLFALKVIETDARHITDYSIEAHMLKNLRHPQLPRIIDIFEQNNQLFIVRDYIEGSDLEQYIDMHGPQPINRCVLMATQIIDVLDYLHNQPEKIIYRDLKPSNLIVTNDDAMMLIDFGTTRTYNPLTTEDTVYLGTKGYAAPEQYGGNQSDERTDIYALGATIYYTFTGEHWSEASNGERFAKFHGRDAEQLRHIIERAMDIVPSKRYQTVQAVKQDLRAKGLIHDVAAVRERAEVNDIHHDKVIVSVMGLARGCGCTHLSLAFARFCAKHLGRTIYYQRTPSHDLDLLENYIFEQPINQKGQSQEFKHAGITFIKEPAANQVNSLLSQKNTNIVIDYATQHHDMHHFLNAHKKIFVLPNNPWAMSNNRVIKEVVQYQDVVFVVNLADDALKNELAQWLGIDKARLYANGYMPNPFEIDESTRVFQDILNVRPRRKLFRLFGGR